MQRGSTGHIGNCVDRKWHTLDYELHDKGVKKDAILELFPWAWQPIEKDDPVPELGATKAMRKRPQIVRDVPSYVWSCQRKERES